jgi:hypothetical protein
LVRNIKAGSSGFINDRRWIAGRFSWQEGFGGFSYSHSQLSTVIRYIENSKLQRAALRAAPGALLATPKRLGEAL